MRRVGLVLGDHSQTHWKEERGKRTSRVMELDKASRTRDEVGIFVCGNIGDDDGRGKVGDERLDGKNLLLESR